MAVGANTATTTATFAAAITTAATTTAVAAWTIFARTRLVDRQWAALEFLLVKQFDGLPRLLGSGHFDEAKPTRFAGHFILDDVG